MFLEHKLSVLLHTGASPFIVLHFTVLHGCCILINRRKTLHQQKDYDWLYCNVRFIVVVRAEPVTSLRCACSRCQEWSEQDTVFVLKKFK